MFRIPVNFRGSTKFFASNRRYKSSNIIRNTFIEFFKGHYNHEVIRSSPVIPLCDPTVPFVNAGMNQFKSVFLGTVEAPNPRVVNSQKCVRVGGKHNDLDLVGLDGFHHTFFEMLGNWSFGDYYKADACKMAWELVCGPFGIKPENLLVTYFRGDCILRITEDLETRDIWRSIGVPRDRLVPRCSDDNFWEMGPTGPCGPCTEIHYVNPDGSLTELWNIVFIQSNRQPDGTISPLPMYHVDTGMGLERMAALLQGASSNYHTDLFAPILKAIHQKSKNLPAFSGRYGEQASLDTAYRRLADHARMISVCLADAAVPANNLKLKQIMQKSFKISSEVFKCPSGMLVYLYDAVAETLSDTYPELIAKERDAKMIIQQEEANYAKLTKGLAKKWKKLVDQYPETVAMIDVQAPGFPLGYRDFKTVMEKRGTDTVTSELYFYLYSTHGLQDDVIQRMAELNDYKVDKTNFDKLLAKQRFKHKAAFKAQADDKGFLFDNAIREFNYNGVIKTFDDYKYQFESNNFEPHKTRLIASLDSNAKLMYEIINPNDKDPYYIVTESTNFFCEEGGQIGDSGYILLSDNLIFQVETAFKIRDIVFHKGFFKMGDTAYNNVYAGSEVFLNLDSNKRFAVMKNHTAAHLFNAALRSVLQNSFVYQCGSSIHDKGFSMNLSAYGETITKKDIFNAQELVRKAIAANKPVSTSVLNRLQLANEGSVLTVPGEIYPETGLRVVTVEAEGIVSKELCCGTHVPSTGFIEDFYVTTVKNLNSKTQNRPPSINAISGPIATKAREQFSRAESLTYFKGFADLDEIRQEAEDVKAILSSIIGTRGLPVGNYAECLKTLDTVSKSHRGSEKALDSIARAEIDQVTMDADRSECPYTVHFLRCSYLMSGDGARSGVGALLPKKHPRPVMLLACASGTLGVACHVPEQMVTSKFNALMWINCVLPVFDADLLPNQNDTPFEQYAEMEGTKVSLITCEQLVSDAMKAAIKFANANVESQPPGISETVPTEPETKDEEGQSKIKRKERKPSSTYEKTSH